MVFWVVQGLDYLKDYLGREFCWSATTPGLRPFPNLPHSSQVQSEGGWEIKGWWLTSNREIEIGDEK